MRDPADVIFPDSITAPSAIVERITLASVHPPTDPQTSTAIPASVSPAGSQSPTSTSEFQVTQAPQTSQPQPVPQTQLAMADALRANKKIFHVHGFKSFAVEGIRGDQYMVKLFPVEKCECPATTTFHHIIAVRKVLGINIEPSKKILFCHS